MRVLVIGAGVTGLSVGVRLVEQGYDVHLLARDLPLETTSSVAAAIWYPYLIQPLDRVLGWSRRSFEVFSGLAADPDSGVTMRPGTELLRTRVIEPTWASIVSDFTRLGELPPGYEDGWSFTTPVIEMPVYLQWLQRRLEVAGGTLTRKVLAALPNQADLVVNCAGLGSRLLAADATLTPVRGQVVRLAQVGLDRWLLDGEGLTYVVPRADDVIVGGTDTEDAWDRRPDPAIAAEIMSRAITLVPQLAGAAVLGHRVGLRPARPAVRLEVEQQGRQGVIHCYGHGGAGVTTSWGCADEVLSMVEAAP